MLGGKPILSRFSAQADSRPIRDLIPRSPVIPVYCCVAAVECLKNFRDLRMLVDNGLSQNGNVPMTDHDMDYGP